jgi:acetyl-CoA synthetase
VIITSSYRIGPLEVESAILDHSDVEQVGGGVPDPTRGQRIKAFVQSVGTVDDVERLREAIRSSVRNRLAKYAYPARSSRRRTPTDHQRKDQAATDLRAREQKEDS